MNYTETIDFLYSRLPVYHRIGKAAYKSDLGNSLALDRYFGFPHRRFNSVHIAGTNGKGSVSHIVASVLQEAGYRTGLYTSPHLKDYRERIRISGEMIPEDKIVSFVEKNWKVIELVGPSFFEMSVAMAFDYFSRENIDIAVIETGLGGRLDSTNIISPVLSVITNIGHDHMDLLGNTLEEIAGEKAGIIKQGIPVVIGESQEKTKAIFISRGASLSSPVVFADEDYLCTAAEFEPETGIRNFCLRDLRTDMKYDLSSPLGGDYQESNIQTAIKIFEMLSGRYNLNFGHFKDGLRNVVRNTGLAGRWQVLGKRPLVICDTGHNKDGLQHVITQLKSLKAKNLHMVIGFVNDKDLSSILPMFPVKAKYYFTRSSVPRALDPELLRRQALSCGLKGKVYSNVGAAIASATGNASPEDLIFIGGSTFVVADAL